MVVTGAVLRLLIFPFAENLWGDAPVRSELAQAWARHPGLWWSFRDVFQFGPLPVHLGGIAVFLGLGGDVGPRLISLVCGILSLLLVERIARRLGGEQSALVAVTAVALSPLHIQASTTFMSEAIYLFFVLISIERTLAESWGLAGLAVACSTVTRYDAWLWLPGWALWGLWCSRSSVVGSGIAAFGPLSILFANWRTVGDPLKPLHFIDHEHLVLALESSRDVGPLLWRVGTVLFWPLALVIALTPGFAGHLICVLRRRQWSAKSDVWALPALLPPGVYAAKALVGGTFWPMFRLAIPSAVVLAVTSRPVARRTFSWLFAGALATNVVLISASLGGSTVGRWASRLTPLSRLPDDMRAGVLAARERPDSSVIDEGKAWEDIVIAYHAKVDRWEGRARAKTHAPERIVAVKGGPLDSELRMTGTAFHKHYRRIGEAGRVSWWDRTIGETSELSDR